MSRSAKRLAGLMVLAACFGSPIDDIETALLVLALAVGASLLGPPLLSQRLRPAGRSSLAPARVLCDSLRRLLSPPSPASGTGPATVLRV